VRGTWLDGTAAQSVPAKQVRNKNSLGEENENEESPFYGR